MCYNDSCRPGWRCVMRIYLLALAAILTLAACIGSGVEGESEEKTPAANPIEPTIVTTVTPCDTPTPCPECPEQAPCPACPEPIVCPTCPTCPTCPEPIVCPGPIPCPVCPTCPQPTGPSVAQQCADARSAGMVLSLHLETCEDLGWACKYERETLAEIETFLNAYCR